MTTVKKEEKEAICLLQLGWGGSVHMSMRGKIILCFRVWCECECECSLRMKLSCDGCCDKGVVVVVDDC